MKIYVINLPKDMQRLADMQAQLQNYPDVEIVEACYGKELSQNDLERQTTDFGRDRLSLSEIGCALSHHRIYERMVEQNIPMALVLEDDVFVSNDVPHILKYLECHLDQDKPEVILLTERIRSYRNINFRHIDSRFRIAKVFSGYGTYGYVLTLAAAKNMNENLYPVELEADFWSVIEHRAKVKVYAVLPSVIGFSEYAADSGITHSRTGQGNPVSEPFKQQEQALWKEGKTVYRKWYVSILKKLGWYGRVDSW